MISPCGPLLVRESDRLSPSPVSSSRNIVLSVALNLSLVMAGSLRLRFRVVPALADVEAVEEGRLE